MTTAILCILWALWPVAAFTGGMGFTLLAGLAAILLLPGALQSLRPRLYIAALAAFLIYAGVSANWSPRETPLVEFDFAALKFAVRSEMIRVGLLILAIGGLMAAAASMREAERRRLASVSQVALLVQLAVLLSLTLFEAQALALFSGFMPDSGEGVQNISRNCLIMALAAPFLAIGLLEGRSTGVSWGMAAAAVGLASLILTLRGVHAGLLAMVAATICMLIVRIMPRHGFKALGVLVGVAVITAPWTFGFLTQGADFASADDSTSYRAAIWQRVVQLIDEQVVFGHGIGVLRTIRESIESGVFAGQLTIPNHSHNMMLQVWAETGLVGAGLLSLAIVLAGFRMPSADRIGMSAYRAAALVGGLTAVAGVSFDLWNEWWWAVGGLLAVLTIASPREPRPPANKPSGSIVFDGGHSRASSSGSTLASLANANGEDVTSLATELPKTARSSTYGSDVRPSTYNNFHLVRLLLALAVAAYHAALLPGIADWRAAEPPLSLAAELGVQGFFVVSGYLVWTSLQRSSSVWLYAEKRCRRLLPAYVGVILVSAMLALAVSDQARADIGSVARYVGWNLAFVNFLEPNLPGLFEANRFTEVNGALWTLKIEVMFYLILPLLSWMLAAAGRYRWLAMAVIYVSAEVWRISFEHMSANDGGGILAELSRQLPGQMSFFITGIALAAWRQELNWKSALVPVALILLAASIAVPSLDFLRAIGIGVTVVWVATGLPRLFDAAYFGDFSYGLYISHFPIVQVLVAAGAFTATPWIGFIGALTASLAAAVLLWWLVERPVLRSDSAYRNH